MNQEEINIHIHEPGNELEDIYSRLTHILSCIVFLHMCTDSDWHYRHTYEGFIFPRYSVTWRLINMNHSIASHHNEPSHYTFLIRGVIAKYSGGTIITFITSSLIMASTCDFPFNSFIHMSCCRRCIHRRGCGRFKCWNSEEISLFQDLRRQQPLRWIHRQQHDMWMNERKENHTHTT